MDIQENNLDTQASKPSNEDKKTQQETSHASRRDFLKTASAGALATFLGGSLLDQAEASTVKSMSKEAMSSKSPSHKGPYNIMLIVTDQERYFRSGELPKGYHLPAHERLSKSGIVFENHRINSCVCTPSRSVIYTGLHI